MRLAPLGLFLQILFYVASGVNHFRHPSFYLRIMPDHYSHPDFWAQLSGVAEMLGGLGLAFPVSRRWASFGLALLLIVFLDVHVFMLSHSQRFPEIPLWVLWARLPLQGFLIAWALYYARSRVTRHKSELSLRSLVLLTWAALIT